MPRTKPLPNLNHQQALNLCRRQRAKINRLERNAAMYERALCERGKDLCEAWKRIDYLESSVVTKDGELQDMRAELSDCELHSHLRAARVDALLNQVAALSQRYAGVKLDTQQFTFAQAQEWLRNEDAAVAAMLNRIVDDASRNECQQQAEQRREAA
jgi:hypothetical protein